MINVTENAKKELETYFTNKEKSPLRIYLASGGWSGPRLALALDEPNQQTDTILEEGDLTFCIDKELLSSVKSVTVDMNYMGFNIEPELPLNIEGGGGGCGSCSSGGCG